MVKLKKALITPLKLGTFSVGTNLIGSALDSRLPPGVTNPLTSLGTSSATAAGLTGTIGLTGVILEETRNLNPDRKRKRK